MEDLLKEYPVIMEIPVAWGEMDALGHVNNVVYYRYFECARVVYLEKIDYRASTSPDGFGPILSATSCRYKFPLQYPDVIRVGARTIRIAEDRFTMEYAIVSTRYNKIAAVGEAEIVSYDFRNSGKTPLPQSIVKKIEDIEGARK